MRVTPAGIDGDFTAKAVDLTGWADKVFVPRANRSIYVLLGVMVAAITPNLIAQMAAAPVIAGPSSPTLTGASTVPLSPTTVSLQITSPLAVFYGEAIDGIAQVTSSDGAVTMGTVTFFDGAKAFCTLALTNGASCTGSASATFDAGTHVFTAVYSGDPGHAAATSNSVTVVVHQDATTTALATSASPVMTGTRVTYAAVVQGAHGPVVGEVEFLDGSTSIGRSPVDGTGHVSLAVVMMAPGIHQITASYLGSVNSLGSTSAVVKEEVLTPLLASTTTLRANADVVNAGANVVLTAQVSAGGSKPTGMVAFVDGGTVLGSVALDGNAAASWNTAGLSTGQHSIVARYSGDGATAASVSSAVVVTVTSVASSDDSFTLGLKQVAVNAGEIAVVPVVMTRAMSASIVASCSGLPDEATCSYAAGTLRIQTAGPRDCGASTPYGVAGISLVGPMLAGLMGFFVPGRRLKWKGLVAALFAMTLVFATGGCGTGNCTDLGSRPGSYTVSVQLSGMSGVQKVVLVVKP